MEGLKKIGLDSDSKGIPLEFLRIEEIWIQRTITADRVYIKLGYYTDQASYIAGNGPVETRRVNVPLVAPEIPEVKEGEPELVIEDPFADVRDTVIEEVDAFIARAYLLTKKMPEWADSEDV